MYFLLFDRCSSFVLEGDIFCTNVCVCVCRVSWLLIGVANITAGFDLVLLFSRCIINVVSSFYPAPNPFLPPKSNETKIVRVTDRGNGGLRMHVRYAARRPLCALQRRDAPRPAGVRSVTPRRGDGIAARGKAGKTSSGTALRGVTAFVDVSRRTSRHGQGRPAVHKGASVCRISFVGASSARLGVAD